MTLKYSSESASCSVNCWTKVSPSMLCSNEYLTALEDEETGAVADDDALMTGVLMGVSLEILCPEHRSDS